MPTNPYFDNFTQAGEQNLLHDLIIESIKIYGQRMFYIPRTLNNFDKLYGEDTISSFDNAYEIVMYIKSVDGFSGDGAFLSKFGLEIRDEVVFTVAVRTFEEYVERKASILRPNEGDLIYFPLNKKLFQIKFVDYKPFFYQLGDLQTFDLVAELFEYSNEDFNTGIAEIDDIQDKESTDLHDSPFILKTEAGLVLKAENGALLMQEDYDSTGTSNDENSDNEAIQEEQESGDIIDWSEQSPFSEDRF